MADERKLVQVTIRFPLEMHERLRRASFESRRSMNDMLLQATDEYLGQEGYAKEEPTK